jgi:alpha-galactosidase
MKLCRSGLLLVSLLAIQSAGAQTPPVAATPPMGWNSWDSYGLTVTEGQFRDNVKVLVNDLKPAGYTYAVIDEGWFFLNPEARSKPDTLIYEIDANGRYIPVRARFPSSGMADSAAPAVLPQPAGAKSLLYSTEPSSFKALADWVHSQGLKFGIHIVRGIPRVSVSATCPSPAPRLPRNRRSRHQRRLPLGPHQLGHQGQRRRPGLVRLAAQPVCRLGRRPLKVDCIASHPYKVDEIRMIRKAIDKTGRPMVLSLSPGPTSAGQRRRGGPARSDVAHLRRLLGPLGQPQ